MEGTVERPPVPAENGHVPAGDVDLQPAAGDSSGMLPQNLEMTHSATQPRGRPGQVPQVLPALLCCPRRSVHREKDAEDKLFREKHPGRDGSRNLRPIWMAGAVGGGDSPPGCALQRKVKRVAIRSFPRASAITLLGDTEGWGEQQASRTAGDLGHEAVL